MNAYSHSALACYEGCPKAFQLRKAHTPSADDPRIMVVGKAGHEALAEYVKLCARSGLPSDADLVDPIVDDLVDDDGKLYPLSIRDEVRRLLTDFCGNYQVSGEGQVWTEREFAYTRDWTPTGWLDKDVRWRARVDLLQIVGSTARITDWKLGWYVPTQDEADDDQQLPRYAAMVALAHPDVSTFEVQLYYARRDWTISRVIHRDQVEGILSELNRQMAQVDSAVEFKANPGPACERCFYRLACPTYRESDRAEQIPVDTVDLAKLYYVTKARLADLDAALKERLKLGPVVLPDDTVVQYSGQERWSVQDVQAACEDLLEAGVTRAQLFEQLSLSKTGLERAAKKVEGLDWRATRDAILKAHGVVSTSNIMRKSKLRKGG